MGNGYAKKRRAVTQLPWLVDHTGMLPARRHRKNACVTGSILFRFVLKHDFAQKANGWHAVIEQQ
jgi:hypothetical protein